MANTLLTKLELDRGNYDTLIRIADALEKLAALKEKELNRG
jgi:hypothetical protein